MGLLSSPNIHDFQVVLNGNGEPRRSYVHDRSPISVQNRARIQTVDFELIHLLTQAEKDVYAHYSIGGEKRYSDIRSFSSTDRLAPVQAESRKENDKAGENERHIPLDISDVRPRRSAYARRRCLLITAARADGSSLTRVNAAMHPMPPRA
jgi:hypothetical protein